MPGTPDSGPPQTIVAFDFGLRRIGVAVGQEVTASASPIAAIGNSEAGPDWHAIESIISDWRPSRLIVGIPSHADGSRADLADKVEAFIAELARFDLPVEQVDERYSTLEATDLLRTERGAGRRGRINKEHVDSVAAALIAERWLQRLS